MTEPILVLDGVSKNYRQGLTDAGHWALTGVSLKVHRAEVHGLLGINGAGKSTANKIILGFVKPTAGEAMLFGQSVLVEEVRLHVGFLAENPSFYEFLTGREHLELAAGLFGLAQNTCAQRTEALMKRLGLKAAIDRRVRDYSRGMRQRLGIAQALVNEPDLLILDEPFSGLDPLGRILLKEIIIQERVRGAAVLMSSHQLLDAEGLCDRVTIMHRGGVIKECTLPELRAQFPGSNLEQIFVNLIGRESPGDSIDS